MSLKVLLGRAPADDLANAAVAHEQLKAIARRASSRSDPTRSGDAMGARSSTAARSSPASTTS